MAWEAISHGWAATECNLCSRDRDPRTGMVASTNWRSSAISCLIRQTQKWFLWLEIYAAPNCYCMLGSLFPFLFVKESYFWTNLLGIKLVYCWMKATFWTNFTQYGPCAKITIQSHITFSWDRLYPNSFFLLVRIFFSFGHTSICCFWTTHGDIMLDVRFWWSRFCHKLS